MGSRHVTTERINKKTKRTDIVGPVQIGKGRYTTLAAVLGSILQGTVTDLCGDDHACRISRA